jgi:glutathione S-transferase
VRAWARSAAAEIHGGFATLRNHCGMNCGVRARLHAAPPALQRDFARIDELWCEGLRRWGGPYLAGAGFGAVDAFFAPVAFRVQTYAIPLSAQASAYADRLLHEPAMRSWYADALQEPWRDADHETELQQYATIVEDLRCASG